MGGATGGLNIVKCRWVDLGVWCMGRPIFMARGRLGVTTDAFALTKGESIALHRHRESKAVGSA